MRDVAYIWDAWKSGRYVGDRKFVTRVTVETSFELRVAPPDGSVLGSWTRGPARWFQRADTTEQVETEIPGVISYHHSRSIDQDAGSCEITIINTKAPEYGAPEYYPGQYGDLGAMTWDHGRSQDAKVRWGHVANEWADILVPNALLRSYQGFGGDDKTIPEAIEDGNLVLNGVWMIDEVNVTTEGTVSIRCRDMANLLVDQQLFPPLVPSAIYPLSYRRWTIEQYAIAPDPLPSTVHEIINQPTTYRDSSTDQYYGGFDTGATGHPPSYSVDWTPDPVSNPASYTFFQLYWLSEPKGGPGDHVWAEWDIPNLDVNIAYMLAWAGNYLVMVSIMENGDWVYPEPGGQGGIGPDGVPYVSTFTPIWEGGLPAGLASNQYPLPRTYHAQRMRYTLTNLVAAQEGGYRGGIRMAIPQLDRSLVEYPRYSFAAAGYPANVDNKVGYWQARSDGRIFAFGDARTQEAASDPPNHQEPLIAMNAHPSGNGYWTMDTSGRIVAYGAASKFGDDESTGRHDAVDFAVTPSGNGYWLLHRDGAVSCFGDATDFGDSSHTGTLPNGAPAWAKSIESHPVDDGYWVLWTDGVVDAHNLPHLGDANRTGFTDTEYVTAIRRTADGSGYWIVSGSGIVQQFNAFLFGNATPYPPDKWAAGLVWDMIPYPTGTDGYALQQADGNLRFFGAFQNGGDFGSYGAGYGQLRSDGNYKDYADIVWELLLWAGFYLYEATIPAGKPDIYGNIETTGSYSSYELPKENFDKRPVIEAIRYLKQLVGYIFYVDAEGGARFESPNWWAKGNYLMDGTPFGYMPEIDETVNLMSHSVTFNANSARSELIIATQDPEPQTAGVSPPTGITVTRVVPPSARDLKGKIVPAMWTNGHFSNPWEQKIMADLISLQMWFARRIGNVSCVANPLIDINDQVMILERQTGDTYVHYVRGVEMSHDILSGDATMSLSTHWLGGSGNGQRLFFAADSDPLGDGYWQVNGDGAVYAWGSAQTYPPNGDDSHTLWVIALRSTPTGDGYYTLDQSGKILAYGDAVNYGHLYRTMNDVIDMAVTPSGDGYWLVTFSGEVFTFGDAVNYGNATVTGTMPSGSAKRVESIEAHPAGGYWILVSDGDVQAFGAAVDYGSADRTGFTPTEYVSSLRRTNSANGYLIVSGSGKVQAFGDASEHGDADEWTGWWPEGLCWSIIVNDSGGYAVQRANGELLFFDFNDQGHATLTDPTVTGGGWAVMPAQQFQMSGQPDTNFALSDDVMQFLAGTGSASATNAVASNFGAENQPTIKAPTE